MRADQLIHRYSMEKHIENGMFIEKHYEHKGEGRPASGSMYYYVVPGEITEFHVIDCDEYWISNAGATLEIWCIEPDGTLQKYYCGTDEGAEPVVYFPKGVIFGSRLSKDAQDSAFVTCITVPRFTYEGSRIFSKEEMIEKYPETKSFWG